VTVAIASFPPASSPPLPLLLPLAELELLLEPPLDEPPGPLPEPLPEVLLEPPPPELLALASGELPPVELVSLLHAKSAEPALNAAAKMQYEREVRVRIVSAYHRPLCQAIETSIRRPSIAVR
jgi:hypothetical protein